MPNSALSLNATLPHVWLPKTRDYIKHRSRAFQSWQCWWIHYFCSSKRSVATEKGINLSHTHLRSTKIQFLRKYIEFHWLNHSIIAVAVYEFQYLENVLLLYSVEKWQFSNKLVCFCRSTLFHRWTQEEDDGRGGEKCGYPVPSSRSVLYVQDLNWGKWIDSRFKSILPNILYTQKTHRTLQPPSDPCASSSTPSFCCQ